MTSSEDTKVSFAGSFDTGVTQLHETESVLAGRQHSEEQAMAIVAELSPRPPRPPRPETGPTGARPARARKPGPAPRRRPTPAPKRPAAIPKADFEPSVIARMPMPAPPPAPAATAAPDGGGQVLAVFACRGGAGATTIAVNTAAALTRAGQRVCLVDLDLQLGDVCVALDLEAGSTLAAVARDAAHLDGAALARRVLHHRSGLCVLSQVGAPEGAGDDLAGSLPGLLAALRRHYDHVVIDGLRDFSDLALAALDASDRIALVLSQDVPAVRRAARAMILFRRLGYADERTALLLNRADKRAAIDEARIARALGRPVAVRIRRDDRRAAAALDDGEPLVTVAPGAGIARDLGALAAKLALLTRAAEAPGGHARLDITEPTRKGGSILGRLAGWLGGRR